MRCYVFFTIINYSLEIAIAAAPKSPAFCSSKLDGRILAVSLKILSIFLFIAFSVAGINKECAFARPPVKNIASGLKRAT